MIQSNRSRPRQVLETVSKRIATDDDFLTGAIVVDADRERFAEVDAARLYPGTSGCEVRVE